MLKRYANAMPEDYDFLKSEYERIRAAEMPKTGAQRAALENECEMVHKHTTAYVQQLTEQRQRLEQYQVREHMKKLGNGVAQPTQVA